MLKDWMISHKMGKEARRSVLTTPIQPCIGWHGSISRKSYGIYKKATGTNKWV